MEPHNHAARTPTAVPPLRKPSSPGAAPIVSHELLNSKHRSGSQAGTARTAAPGVIRRRASAHPRDCFSPGGVVDRLAPWRPVRASGRQALHGSRDRICVFDGAELACASATIQHSDGAGAGVCSAQKESGARALFGRVLRRRGDGGGLSLAPRCGQSHSAQEPPPGAQAETSHWPSTRCGIDARLETCLRCRRDTSQSRTRGRRPMWVAGYAVGSACITGRHYFGSRACRHLSRALAGGASVLRQLLWGSGLRRPSAG